jgi:hypothetical protein
MGDRELGLVQPGIGLAGAQRDEPLLGGLPEPIEIGIRGQSLRHGKPSFPAPGDHNARARKKEMSAKRWRWVRPFTRSVGRLLDQAQNYLQQGDQVKRSKQCK